MFHNLYFTLAITEINGFPNVNMVNVYLCIFSTKIKITIKIQQESCISFKLVINNDNNLFKFNF